MKIQEQFEQNFLDGDKLPAKAITFSAIGGFDIAKYFYSLGKKEAVNNIIHLDISNNYDNIAKYYKLLKQLRIPTQNQ